ncbi:recombination mediator RecR [Kallotenue papyrolyticum]|uniref:recombination mediator RecR n=1 Tax=Kallotenue papyrolyticum TaxID=1325125 RepID=UPI00047863A3|nr:recombination mediator RecR [Kallotenue papyrolyticum]
MATGLEHVTVEPIARLIEEFNKLPGIGPKTASRLTFYLLRASNEQAAALAQAILEVKEKTLYCSRCYNIATSDPCAICSNPARDAGVIMVVEEPLDVLAFERIGEYRGLYHVLHGAISPVEGINPDDLKIRELLARVQVEPVEEVIIATNPTTEGRATQHYIARELAATGVRITALAQGLPVGSDLEYADEVTLSRALENRRDI